MVNESPDQQSIMTYLSLFRNWDAVGALGVRLFSMIQYLYDVTFLVAIVLSTHFWCCGTPSRKTTVYCFQRQR